MSRPVPSSSIHRRRGRLLRPGLVALATGAGLVVPAGAGAAHDLRIATSPSHHYAVFVHPTNVGPYLAARFLGPQGFGFGNDQSLDRPVVGDPQQVLGNLTLVENSAPEASVVVAVVPPSATTVEVWGTGGLHETVPVGPAPAGLPASAQPSAFAFAEFPGEHRTYRAVVRDAAGTTVAATERNPPPAGPSLLVGKGGRGDRAWRVGVSGADAMRTSNPIDGSTERRVCVSDKRPTRDTPVVLSGCSVPVAGTGSAFSRVLCRDGRPTGAVAAASVGDVGSVVLHLTNGKTVRPRIRPAAGDRWWTLKLGRTVGVTSMDLLRPDGSLRRAVPAGWKAASTAGRTCRAARKELFRGVVSPERRAGDAFLYRLDQ
ncbi:hypothetical protein AB0L40_04310 [Patulibacter sp. NPDC049589]|uniref:hypothetical protein n=1 Tax=Patulibacter sp. NPDC049589 TaxID=3154731 RepID=UPI00342D1AD9